MLALVVAGCTDGSIWCGTSKGISLLDGKDRVSYTSADGFADNAVTQISIEPDGIICFVMDMSI
jgi:ligand-binding sensor domain-containing protein